MKYLTLIFILGLFLSCSKQPNAWKVRTDLGTIQYKVNGNPVVVDRLDPANYYYLDFTKELKEAGNSSTRYVLVAQAGGNQNSSLSFAIDTDSLRVMNYHFDSAYLIINEYLRTNIASGYAGESANINFEGDYFDINIGHYENGRVSGTFTAKFSPFFMGHDYNERGTYIITEGVMKDLLLSY